MLVVTKKVHFSKEVVTFVISFLSMLLGILIGVLIGIQLTVWKLKTILDNDE